MLSLGAGAVVFAVLFAGSSSRARLRAADALPVPLGAVLEPWWLAGLRAALPSTFGVGLLGAIALSFSATLAAVLGGVLAGMGVLALVSGLLLALEERESGTKLYVERGFRPRRFTGP